MKDENLHRFKDHTDPMTQTRMEEEEENVDESGQFFAAQPPIL